MSSPQRRHREPQNNRPVLKKIDYMIRKKFILFMSFVLLLLSFPAFAQITPTPDGRGITMKANVFLHFDTQNSRLTKEQFADSLATQNYVFSAGSQNDTISMFLITKAPRDIVGRKLPDIEWIAINGAKIKYGEENKITLLSFWSVICKPCIEEFNELNEWVTSYPDVQIIAVTSDSASVVSAFMNKHNLSWQNITIVPEYKGDFDDIFKIHAWPTNIVTDRRLIVRKVFIGKKEELTEYICSLL